VNCRRRRKGREKKTDQNRVKEKEEKQGFISRSAAASKEGLEFCI